MNLENLKRKLQPQLHKFEIEGETLYIHRPSAMDAPKCNDLVNTVIVCCKDENGDPIFAGEDIDGRINANTIDSKLLEKIFWGITALCDTTDAVDDVEKK